MRKETTEAIVQWLYTLPIHGELEHTNRLKLIHELLRETYIPNYDDDPDDDAPASEPLPGQVRRR